METSWNAKCSGAPAAEKGSVRAGSEFFTVLQGYNGHGPRAAQREGRSKASITVGGHARMCEAKLSARPLGTLLCVLLKKTIVFFHLSDASPPQEGGAVQPPQSPNG
jgi:hypothetical protein